MPDTVQEQSMPTPWIAALVTGWFAYEPIANLAQLKGAGAYDEVLAGSAAALAAVLAASQDTISKNCAKPEDYLAKVSEGTKKGALTGLLASGVPLAILAPLDFGLSLFAYTAVGSGIVASMSGIGALLGRKNAEEKNLKACPNRNCRTNGKLTARCCEKICLKCGWLFLPIYSWEPVLNLDDARRLIGVRMGWEHIASILQFQGLNYPEAAAVMEAHAVDWDFRAVNNGERETFSRDQFFGWFSENAQKIEKQFMGKLPNPGFWRAAEKAVRSECEPNKAIELDMIEATQRQIEGQMHERGHSSIVD